MLLKVLILFSAIVGICLARPQDAAQPDDAATSDKMAPAQTIMQPTYDVGEIPADIYPPYQYPPYTGPFITDPDPWVIPDPDPDPVTTTTTTTPSTPEEPFIDEPIIITPPIRRHPNPPVITFEEAYPQPIMY